MALRCSSISCGTLDKSKRTAEKDKKRDKKSASKDSPKKNRPAVADLSPDLGAVQKAFDLVRKGKARAAIELEATITDPVAKKLVEWWALRRGSAEVSFKVKILWEQSKDEKSTGSTNEE